MIHRGCKSHLSFLTHTDAIISQVIMRRFRTKQLNLCDMEIKLLLNKLSLEGISLKKLHEGIRKGGGGGGMAGAIRLLHSPFDTIYPIDLDIWHIQ